MAKGIVRLGRILGVIVGVVVLLALLAFAASRPPLSNTLVGWVAASRGATPAHVSGAHLGLTGARISAASLGAGPDVAVSDLRLAYTPFGLLHGHIESVEAKSVSVVAAYQDGALKLPLVGKLGNGGGGAASPSTTQTPLPRVEIKSLSVRINGLPVPVTAGGALTLVPAPGGKAHLNFAGRIGAPQPLEGRIEGDIAPTGDMTVNANFAKVPGAAPASGVPGVDIANIKAGVHVTQSGLQSANGIIAVTSGALEGARFGEGGASFAYSKSEGGTLDLNLGGIRLTEAKAAKLQESLRARLAAFTAKPPLSAYDGDIDALLALTHGTGSLSANFAIAPLASMDTPWHITVNTAEAKIAPTAPGKPLVVEVTPSDAGLAEINLATRGGLRATGDIGLDISSPGPSLKSTGARFSFVSGAKGGLRRLVLTGLSFDWPSKALTLGLTASALGYEPAAEKRLTLSGASLDADGVLADGVSAKDLKLALSGGLDAQGRALSFTPETACTGLSFARLTASGQTLANGELQACAEGSAPLISYDPSRAAPLHTVAAIKGGPVTLDMGGTDKVRIASLAADARGDLGGAEPSLQLANVEARLVDGESAARFAPIDIASAVALDNGALAGTLAASSLGKRLLSAKLTGDLVAQTGRVDFDTGQISFTKTSTPIQNLLPVLRGMVTGAIGSVRAQGAFAWRGKRLTSNGKVTLKGFGVGTTLGRIEGIDGTIALNRLLPPRTPGPQTITVKTADVGLPLTDGEVTLNMPDKFELQIVNAHWPWAGGTLGVAKGAFVPGATTQHVEMTANGIELTEVFKLLSIDGLSGNGIVDGNLPIAVRGGVAYIEDGTLKARGQGVLRYKSEAAAVAASKGEGAKLLFTALENFHYQSLEIGVNGRLTGEITITMRLHGYNPALYDGHAFAINIKVQSALAELIKQSTAGLRIPEEIKRSLPGAQ